jgi:hypothetical protein
MSEFAATGKKLGAEFSPLSSRPVIVYPCGAAWIGPLRRPCEAAGLRLIAVSTIEECRDAVGRWPHSLVVLELMEGEIESQLGLITAAESGWAAKRVVVIAKGLGADGEMLLRELGACDVITRLADLGRAAAIAKAHARAPLPNPQEMWRETLREIGLPVAE